MKFTRCRPHILALLAAVSLRSVAGGDGPPELPPNAIESPEIAQELAVAAQRFIDALDPGMQAKYLFQDAERGNFHFFPIARRGVPLKDLKNGQRLLGYALMNGALSYVGNQKALTIMSLGDYLGETDKTPNVYRDSDQYYFTIFGNPSPDGTWGYRVEGFHLSLNVTVVGGRWISVTPSFFGAIPATVPDGPRKGLQVLRNETELGRALAKSFNAQQREIGFGDIPDFLTETVGGLTTGNRRRIERGKPRGVALAAMTFEQREILMKLVREHIGRIRKELADQDLARIDCTGVETIHFLWAGGLEPGEPHHYLIQGSTFLIEYDNTQDDANHVHCVYRDFDNDFGDAVLEHYHKHHHSNHNHMSQPIDLPAAKLVLVAGGGTSMADGVNATEAKLNTPFGVDFDKAGNLYFVELNGHRVGRVNQQGLITTIAGSGEIGDSGDGGPALKAKFNGMHNLAIAPSGDIFIADTWNSRVRRIEAQLQRVSTVAGTGERGFSGDGGPATEAKLGNIYCASLDPKAENLYLVDLDNRRIRAVNLKTGVVRTVAGNGEQGVPDDGVDAVSAPLVDPRAVAANARGEIYILERSGNALRVVDRDGKIRTVVGTGAKGASGDGGAARMATLDGPKHLCFDLHGNVIIADTENHLIRKYLPREGKLVRVAGNGKNGTNGLNGPPEEAELNQPHGVYVHGDGTLYIADSSNDRVLRIDK